MPEPTDRILAARRRAAELARSGDYRGWIEVEKAVAAEGLAEVRIVFGLPQACAAVDEVCRVAAARARGVSFDRGHERRKRGQRERGVP